VSRRGGRALLALALLGGGACGERPAAGAAAGSLPPARSTVEGAAEIAAVADLAAYDLGSAPASRAALPAELHEISGVAVTPDGRVFAHGDEEGTVYQVDAGSGRITGRFSLDGRPADDFEDIAIVGERFFLVTSEGRLLEFGEGTDGGSVPYRSYDTGLKTVCEIEGLAHAPAAGSLLLLCKTMRDRARREQVAIYSWSLADRKVGDAPLVVAPWSALASVTGAKKFNGSALAVVPGGGSLLLVAGPQRLFAEIGPDGAPIRGGALDRDTHPQPEGLAFLPDGALLVATEGGKGAAGLARYAPGE
jgi:uncharacterized protein YjiK